MALLMVGLMVVMGVTGGVSAAQQTCKAKAQTEQVVQQTESYVANANQIFDNLENIGNNVLEQTINLQQQANIATNQLLTMKQQFNANIKKMQIGVSMVIIIVFMLLLGKKLKIY